MSKKVFADDIKEEQQNQIKESKKYEEKNTQDVKEGSDTQGASGFSEEEEKNIKKKRKGKWQNFII